MGWQRGEAAGVEVQRTQDAVAQQIGIRSAGRAFHRRAHQRESGVRILVLQSWLRRQAGRVRPCEQLFERVGVIGLAPAVGEAGGVAGEAAQRERRCARLREAGLKFR